jgi:hypothetical protein
MHGFSQSLDPADPIDHEETSERTTPIAQALLQNFPQFGKTAFPTPKSLQPQFGNDCDQN